MRFIGNYLVFLTLVEVFYLFPIAPNITFYNYFLIRLVLKPSDKMNLQTALYFYMLKKKLKYKLL